MISRFFHLKKKVIELRTKEGTSMSRIEKDFGIPRSTLSGWFRGIELSKKQRDKLESGKLKHLPQAREKAVLWHNSRKAERIEKAHGEAVNFIKGIDINDNKLLEMALAFLYLGEGSKSGEMSLGSSNLEILKFYLYALNKLYGISPESHSFDLHLRYDQDPLEMKKFWSSSLSIPIEKIIYCAIDIRTKNKKTYDTYKGVCLVRKGGAHIQRRLLEIARIYSSMVSHTGAISSSG